MCQGQKYALYKLYIYCIGPGLLQYDGLRFAQDQDFGLQHATCSSDSLTHRRTPFIVKDDW